jgi:hypothetical protein
MRRILFAAAAAAVAMALVASAGCTRVRLAQDPETATRSVEETIGVGAATRLDATIVKGVGELVVSAEPSSTDVLGAVFTFAPAALRPDVAYAVEGDTGALSVKQPQVDGPLGGDRYINTWTLKLGGGVPTRLDLKLGVGTSRVDLRGLDITGLEILCGVGDATIDLSGPRATDLNARVETGIGRTVVRLPAGVGVRVTGREEGLGSTTADGFVAQGDSWVNQAYSGAGPKIEVDLTRGIGELELELVD